MKAADFSNIGLKMEASPRFNLQNQEGMAERFASVISALGNNYGGFLRISGATVSIAGSNYTAAPGSVYYNGELYTVDGNVVNVPGGQTAVWQILKSYTRKAWHGDGTQKDTFYENKMILVAGASGSGVANYNGGSSLQTQLLLYIGQDVAINAAIDALVASAPGALNTLNELADALGDDPNFATTVTNSLATKLNKSGGTMTGAIAMGSNKITGLANGTAAADAVNKSQLDLKPNFDNVISLVSGTPDLSVKLLNIGDWNMDTTPMIDVSITSLGLTTDQIIDVFCKIRPDSGESAEIATLPYMGTGLIVEAAVTKISSSLIRIERRDAGAFDSTVFDEVAGYNRGDLLILYKT